MRIPPDLRCVDTPLLTPLNVSTNNRVLAARFTTAQDGTEVGAPDCPHLQRRCSEDLLAVASDEVPADGFEEQAQEAIEVWRDGLLEHPRLMPNLIIPCTDRSHDRFQDRFESFT